MLDRLFGLGEHQTTVGIEVTGGLTTFMVMAYIIFVNPAVLPALLRVARVEALPALW